MAQTYKVTDATWLAESTALIKEILTSPHRIGQSWTVNTFKAELALLGLQFTNNQLSDIADQLIADGVLIAE